MKILSYLKNNLLYLDGAMGTLLQERGLKAGQLSESVTLTSPEQVYDVHKAYFDAGCNVVCTNTFGVNGLKYSQQEIERLVKRSVELALKAKRDSEGKQKKWVALDVGPLGRMLKPCGDVNFEQAVEAYSKVISVGAECGVDLIFIETISDAYETKAAVIAAKESCSLPVFVSNAYGEDGLLTTGASPEVMVAMLEGLGVDAIGVNCSFGPDKLAPIVQKYLSISSVPVIFKPNAGLPRVENGKTVFDLTPTQFAQHTSACAYSGVRIIGGCCGTTPSHVGEVIRRTAEVKLRPIEKSNKTVITSGVTAVTVGDKPVLVGERINPTGKKLLKEALRNHDLGYILSEGLGQQEKGAISLDVNVGLPGIDEQAMLTEVVTQLQAVVNLPLQIDTSSVSAMESALRIYNGKALINSVSGKKESMDAVFPLVKKYGGVVIALTLDESGIPPLAEDRLKIAEKIIKTAKSYGIDKRDIIFDPLALSISADEGAGEQTLKAVELITKKLKCFTSLGVSNVSFGLPNREVINATFFAMALNSGLSMAIMNPYSAEMMKAYYSFMALSGKDKSCKQYVQNIGELAAAYAPTATTAAPTLKAGSPLQSAIIKGLKGEVEGLTRSALAESDALSVINKHIIPALDVVGEGYEKKAVFLPQLLISAECAKTAFEVIKSNQGEGGSQDKATFVIATVEGDIHDIGKNIVKLLLENYGFKVIDLGKDVKSELVVDAVVKSKAPLVGLSALMTTTVPYMEKTIKLLRQGAPWCKIAVGGAVLTEEYAATIGADKYCKDAMDTVRYAESVAAELEN